MERRTIHRYETVGTILIIILGSLMHFVFEWLDSWKPSAFIAAVNESTWEHLKIAFWPALIFAMIEFLIFKGKRLIDNPQETRSFWVGKAIGLLIMPLTIIFLYYGYAAILGEDYLIIDIMIFIIAVIAGQIASFYAFTRSKPGKGTFRLAIGVLVLLAAAFSLLSYSPPQTELFRDPVTGGYGIPK